MELEIIIKQALGDKYEIQSVIGKGGMATVYKAIQKSLNRLVALKVIHQNLVHDEELVKRFIREAQVCASLDHSNIVTVYDVGSIGTIHFMSMEYLEGMTLRDLIKSKVNLSVEETSNNIIPIADALDYMHREGIIHRDVKSSNIFITKKGRAVLMDFGIVYSEGRESLSQYGTVLGTPEYMSPEQAEGNIKIDGRSDIYGLGVILFECLTGRLPFHSDNYISTLHHVLHEAPPTVTSVNPQLPKWISSIVSACLVKDRDLRLKSGSILTTALKDKQVLKTVYKNEENGTRKIELNNIILNDNVTQKINSEVKKKKNWVLMTLIASICILLVVILYLVSVPSGNSDRSQPVKQDSSNLVLEKHTLVNQTKAKSDNLSSNSNQTATATNKENGIQVKVLELIKQGDQYLKNNDPEKALLSYNDAIHLDPTNNRIQDKIVAASNIIYKKQQALPNQKTLNKVKALVQQGDQYLDQDEPKKALTKYSEALYLAPSNRVLNDKIQAAKQAADQSAKDDKILAEIKQEARPTNNEVLPTNNNINNSGTITDIEGNIYKTVTIGQQVWMAENLKTTKYNDGTVIPNVSDNYAWSALTTPAYCWYNNDAATNKAAYGALYNWYTVSPTNNGVKNVCPTGWHVPTDAEWTTLITYLGGESVAGGKLKATGTTHWTTPNTGATNETGFTALPGGVRGSSGTFSSIGGSGCWWSSTENSTSNAYNGGMVFGSTSVLRYYNYERSGFSVRCVRDF